MGLWHLKSEILMMKMKEMSLRLKMTYLLVVALLLPWRSLIQIYAKFLIRILEPFLIRTLEPIPWNKISKLL